jgi:choline dehydrogenase-like flavoprotein
MGHQDGFDIVIVGAGAAGCLLARRLSESGDRAVLLREAGPDLRSATPVEFREAASSLPTSAPHPVPAQGEDKDDSDDTRNRYRQQAGGP